MMDTVESPIWAGNPVSGKAGVVYLNMLGARNGVATVSACTGTMIGPKTILTAAHCIVPGEQLVQVRYFRPGRSPQSEGEWLGSDTLEAFATPRDNYTGPFADKLHENFDFHHDVAVIRLTDPDYSRWPSTDYVDYVRVSQLTNDAHMPAWFETYGAGYEWNGGDGEAGVLRHGHFQVDDVYDLYVELNTGDEGVCSGDSGGPSMAQPSSSVPEMVFGVTAWTDLWNDGDRCGYDGLDWRFARTSGTNGSFLRNEMPECLQLQAGNYPYLRCFDTPFISDTYEGVGYEKPTAVALTLAALL